MIVNLTNTIILNNDNNQSLESSLYPQSSNLHMT